ncbi:MAG TPA: hypothetical protein VFD03_07850 [Clostridia bacterium]|nr:hypothetical protein [Clostridia bacterium]
MARSIGMESLLQKIDLAQARIIKTKAVYDEAVGDLQILLNIRKDEIWNAITQSRKSYEEILKLIVEDNNVDKE